MMCVNALFQGRIVKTQEMQFVLYLERKILAPKTCNVTFLISWHQSIIHLESGCQFYSYDIRTEQTHTP